MKFLFRYWIASEYVVDIQYVVVASFRALGVSSRGGEVSMRDAD